MKKILIVEDESLVAQHLKSVLKNAGYKVCAIVDNVKDALKALRNDRPDLVLIDIQLKGELNGIDLARDLTAENIAFVFLTANFEGALLEQAKETLPFGFIVKPFREFDLLATLDVAFFRHQYQLDIRYKNEKDLFQKISAIKVEGPDLTFLLAKTTEALQHHIPFDYLNFKLRGPDGLTLSFAGFLRIGFEEYQYIADENFANITGITPDTDQVMNDAANRSLKHEIFEKDSFERLLSTNSRSKHLSKIYDFRSALFTPDRDDGSPMIRLEFYNRKSNVYTYHYTVLLNRVQEAFATLLSGIDGQDVNLAANSDQTITMAQKNERAAVNFDSIVGQSSAMLSILDKIEIVAPLDTSVLILGESGTGKERVAKSIHKLSDRSDRPLVVVNCASLPSNLVESELFGHEKGSFTGASERRLGKFEIANGGTIFLDEIGELTLDMQVKLLRVLQEQEIDRIGGRAPIKINVRIIAATNRDLEAEMEIGRFRLDLYYRLFVFPISVPSLRERPEDIPVLSNYFIGRYAQKYKKAMDGISAEIMSKMLAYNWPGNVRELEHFIERSVLLAQGKTINDAELPRSARSADLPVNETSDRLKTIDENERDYILLVLKQCNGRIRGDNGAAVIMGLPPTTLHSKMKRLGIR